jgi:hypothetical protein
MRLAGAATLIAALAALAAGCGDKQYGATEFIDAVNAQGADLALGDQISSTEAGEPILAINFAAAAGSDPNPQLHTGQGSGSLIVAADTDSATAEFDRCDQSADLTCFRAANIVLEFEGMDAADRARVSGAVSALASEG